MRKSRLAESTRIIDGIQVIDWGLIGGFPPHKIFLWDRLGTYLDCEFPNPIHGHFLGGEKLRGTTIDKVFLPQQSQLLLEAIRQAARSHVPTMVRIDIAKTDVSYQSVIRMLPMRDVVVGWVNDLVVKVEKRNGHQLSHQKAPLLGTPLTPREWEIAKLVSNKKSNEEIAHLLAISERTVKFHLSHVLEKLQVTRRAQVQALIPLLQ